MDSPWQLRGIWSSGATPPKSPKHSKPRAVSYGEGSPQSSEVDRLRSELQASQLDAEDLRTQLQDARARADAAAEKMEELQLQAAHTLEGVSDTVESLHKRLAQAEKDAKAAQAEVAYMRRQHNDELALIIETNRDKDRVHEEQEQELKRRMVDLEQKLEEVTNDLHLAMKEVEEQRSAREDMEEKVASLTAALELAVAQIENLQLAAHKTNRS